MSKRVDAIEESGIRKIFDKAATLKNVVNLSIGQPDFEVPSPVLEGIKKALDDGVTKYTPSAGLPELRSKIEAKYGFGKSIITVGTSGAILLSYSTLLDPDDELIIFDPYFVIYPNMCKFLGVKPIYVKTNDDFSVDFGLLEKAITPKTKAIMVNSPGNPTGYVMSSSEVDKIVAVAKANDLWIISDEVYTDFDYDGKFVSFGGKYEKVVVLGGFSKNFALTGMRCGYAVAPSSVIDDMIKLQQYSFVCAPSAVQKGISDNFDFDVSLLISKFKLRRDLIYNELKDKFNLVKPSGAFYYFIKVENGSAFADKCISKGLMVVPGGPFSLKDDHFRISYAVDDEELKKGIEILKSI